jgi:hypothetical protein
MGIIRILFLRQRRHHRTHHHFILGMVIILFFFIITNSTTTTTDAEEEDQKHSILSFLMACSEGDLDTFHAILKHHPEYIQQPPSYFSTIFANEEQETATMGESCLHVAGILGQVEITNAALQAGADPNVRSAFAHGLRMTPLAFHVYGGHVDTIQLLLQAGAKVNMDMDHMLHPEKKATVMDILLDVLLVSESQDDPLEEKYLEIEHLLQAYGAKRYEDLHQQEL